MADGSVLEDKKQEGKNTRWSIYVSWKHCFKVHHGHHITGVLFLTALLFVTVQHRWGRN